MKSDQILIEHIENSILLIKEYSIGLTRENLEGKTETVDAIIRRIEIIGEATKNLSENLKKKFPDIPWSEIAKTRDWFIHHYFDIDMDKVWFMVKEDVPYLEDMIKNVKEKTSPE